MRRPRLWSELAAALVLATSAPASAQTASAEPTLAQKNAAQSLFDESRRLLDDGKVAEACGKLEESYRLYAASGTLLNLALCHERAGKTGSAYTEFNESLARAQRDRRPEREQTARVHLGALAPRLAHLTVTVTAGADVEGLEVTLDGVPWRRPSWGVATIVDPGEHVVAATAPGRVPWNRTVSLREGAGGPGDQQSVEVPPLAASAAPPPAPIAPASPREPSSPVPGSPPEVSGSRGSGQKTLGVVLGVAGGAGLATGVVLGILAQSKWSTAKNDCPAALCPDTATRARDTGAGGLADGATVALIAGGALVATGAVLFLTAPGGTSRVGVAPVPGGAVGSFGGVW